MNDDTLKTLLADYAAPTPDDGFSEAVLRKAMEAEDIRSNTVDLDAYKPSGKPVRRSWIISLVLGLIVGLLWVRLGIVLPDLPNSSDLPQVFESGWMIYAAIGVALSGLFLFVEVESH